MKTDVLVVDDREKLCTSLITSFRERGYTGAYALNSTDALARISRSDVGVVVLDVMLGNENGIDLMRDIRKLKRNIPVIMITGHGSVGIAVEALKAGAIDFLEKPVRFETLLEAFEKATSLRHVSAGIEARETIRPVPNKDLFVAQDPLMVEILVNAAKLAESDLPILITGESGTGKELIADFIHGLSSRAEYPIEKINCAAFPESILDNELFGHERGAYTGADDRYRGVFERADHGTLLMDELGDMPMFLQPKVLRAIQNREIRRLGGSDNIHIDVRFIASTNKDLREMIRSKEFREDLYYRLNAAQISIPPLRDRRGDISFLAENFLEQTVRVTDYPNRFDGDVLEILQQHDWPGNVRELQNAVRYSAAISKRDEITIHDLPPYLISQEQRGSVDNGTGSIQSNEKRLIESTLRKVDYNKKKAAELLNISRVTLYKKIEKYEISLPGSPR